MKNRRYTLISTAVVIVIWAILAWRVNDEIKLPSPQATFRALIVIMTSKNFLVAVLSTVERAMLGFVIAFASGVVLGIGAGVSSAFYYLLKPIVLVQRAIPTMGVILLALIWMGRDGAPILVCILVIFPIIYNAVVTSIREVDQRLLEMTRVYRLSRAKKLKHLYLPSIRSSLLAVSAAAISLNLKITIAAEILGQPGIGMGTGFQIERVSLNTAGIMAWSIVAILLAALLEYLISPRFLGRFNPRFKR